MVFAGHHPRWLLKYKKFLYLQPELELIFLHYPFFLELENVSNNRPRRCVRRIHSVIRQATSAQVFSLTKGVIRYIVDDPQVKWNFIQIHEFIRRMPLGSVHFI